MDCCIENKDIWFRYSVRAIIIEENCLLTVKNEEAPYLYTVGGGVHLGESAQEVLHREIREETGLVYEIDRLAFIHEKFIGQAAEFGHKKGHSLELHFLMKPKGKKPAFVCDSKGMTGAKESLCWIECSKLASHFFYPEFYKEKLLNLKDGVEHIVTRQ